jgi:hypothetical protein
LSNQRFHFFGLECDQSLVQRDLPGPGMVVAVVSGSGITHRQDSWRWRLIRLARGMAGLTCGNHFVPRLSDG